MPTRARSQIYEGPVLGEAALDFLVELWRFMRVRKKFWLLPLLIMMLVMGGLVVLTQGSAVAPNSTNRSKKPNAESWRLFGC